MSIGTLRPVLPWRTRPAAWLILPAVAAAGLFAARFLDRTTLQGYWPAVVGAAAAFLLFSCTLSGTAAAIEASRMRRSCLDTMPSARSGARVLLMLLGPCYLAGLLVQLAALAGLSIGTWGAPGSPPVSLLAAYAAILALHTALGYLLGRTLPLPAAIPVAVVASFVWLGFTGSTSAFRLRWLAGYALQTCCDIAYQPNPAAPAAAIIFSIPAAIALLLLAQAGSRRARITVGAGASLLLIGAFVAGLAIAPDAAEAGEARPTGQARCTGTNPATCLFPEQVAAGGDPAGVLTRATRNLHQAGVRTPAILTAAVDPPAGSLSLVVQRHEPTPLLVHSLVASMLPDPSIGSECSEARATASFAVYGIAEHWLAAIASRGLTPATAVPATSGDLGARDAARLATAPPRRQAAWFQHNLQALHDCRTPFRPVPRR